jgi:hypothetical protein
MFFSFAAVISQAELSLLSQQEETFVSSQRVMQIAGPVN